jgi:hypothetical protein
MWRSSLLLLLAQADEGRSSLTLERRLYEGSVRISVAPGPDGRLDVAVEHRRPLASDRGAADILKDLARGVSIRLRVTGEGVTTESVEHDNSGITNDPKAGRSTARAAWSGSIRGTPRMTLDLEIVEPEGTPHSISIPFDSRRFAMARCEEELKEEAALRKKIAEFHAKLEARAAEFRRALRLRDELDLTLSNAQAYLDHALYFLRARRDALDAFDDAFQNAQAAEDIIGLAFLGIGLVRGGAKLLIKHSAKLQKTLQKDPKSLMQIKRLLSMCGEGSDVLKEAARNLDAARLDAVNELILAEGKLKNGIELKGTARPWILEGQGEWKGLRSDIDIQFDSVKQARDFEKKALDRLNEILKQRGFGAVARAGDLKINTFVGNLSEVFEDAGIKFWIRGLLKPRYLANPDAYRTLGSSKFARNYERMVAPFEPLDGFEIVMESAHRAEMAWRAKNYVDPQVFKDLKKLYERAKAGERIRGGDAGELAEIFRRLRSEDGLLRQAGEVVDAERSDAKLARKLLQEIRRLGREISLPPDLPEGARRRAMEIGLKVLEAERRGAKHLDLELLGLQGMEDARMALEESRQSWARELRLPAFLSAVFHDVGSAGFVLGEVGSAVFNPVTWGWKKFLKLLLEPGEEQLKDARFQAKRAADLLAEAEGRWKEFAAATVGLDPRGLEALRAEIERAAAAMERHADCFELLASFGLAEIEEGHAELADFERRLRNLRDHFPRAEILQALHERLGIGPMEEQARLFREERRKLEERIGELNEEWLRLDGSNREEDKRRRHELREELRQVQERIAEIGQFEEGLENAKATHAFVQRTIPMSLRFPDLAQAIFDRVAESEGGKIDAAGLASYFEAIRGLIRGLRRLEADADLD